MAEKYEKILIEAKKRLKIAIDAESENRNLAEDDIKFRNNEQWEEKDKRQRELEGRPCLTINKLEQRIDQVTGDQRMNRMGAIIRPLNVTQSNGNFQIAQIYSGIIKNIEAVSNAKQAYTTAFDHAVGHGFGYWRIVTEYSDDDSFDQDIRIKRIANSFRVYLDPSAQEATKKDAMWGFISSMVDKSEAPEGGDWSLSGVGDDDLIWFDGEKVRIVEYFRRVKITNKIGRLPMGIGPLSGKTVTLKSEDVDIEDELAAQGIVPEKTRNVVTYKVEWYKMGINNVFEKADFPSKYIPIIPCYGKELNVEGKTIYRGVIRYAKDPQRIYNYTRTASIEQVALAPKAPWVLEEGQIGDHGKLWETANQKNYSILPYKNVPGVPPPMRQPPPQPSSGWISESSISDQDIDAASGMYKSSLGAPGNERSGKAINARKMEGDVGTFHFHDNRAFSLQHTYEILVDMIPRVYDSKRIVRIKTPEDKEEMITINEQVFDQQTGQFVTIYDLSQGKYDVSVDVGASYTTQREQAAQSMMELLQYVPQIGGKIVDLIAKNLDWPGAEDIAKRLSEDPGIPQEQVKKIVDEEVAKAVAKAKEDQKFMIEWYKARTDRVYKNQTAENQEASVKIELLKLLDENTSDEEIRMRGRELINRLDEEPELQNAMPPQAQQQAPMPQMGQQAPMGQQPPLEGENPEG